MKKTIQLISLLVILGLMIGVYLYVRPLMQNRLQEEAANKDPEIERIYVINSEPDTITEVAIRSAESNLVLTKKDEQWELTRPYPVKLNPAMVSAMASAVTSLSATDIVEENPSDVTDYGLNPPQATVTVTFNDGTKKIVELGNLTPTRSGIYLMLRDDPKVYIVPQFYALQMTQTLSDLRDKTLPSFTSEYFESFRLTRKGGRVIEVVNNTEQSEQDAQYGFSIWNIVRPYKESFSVRGDQFKKILDALDQLSGIAEYVDDQPKNLGTYGLNPPEYELVVKDKYTTLHLLVGKAKDDWYYYCKFPDAPSVFLISKSQLPFLDTKPFDLLDKFVALLSIDTLKRISIQTSKKTYEITLSRKLIKKATNPATERDQYENTYKVDGKVIPEKPFKIFYQQLIGLMVEGENLRPGQAPSAPEVKTVFYLTEGKPSEVTVEYVPYNQDFYAVYKKGYSEFVISKDRVKRMLSDLDDLIAGKLEIPEQ